MATITSVTTLIDTNLADNSNIIPSEHRAVEHALLQEATMLYEVKQLDCPSSFITANFDGTGLGLNVMTGWAICNGNNGTKDRQGRTPIGYGTGYTTIGATGGSADAVLVDHNHDVVLDTSVNTSGGAGVNVVVNTTNNAADVTRTTTNAGVSGVGKNMQPYIVTLFVQRIA